MLDASCRFERLLDRVFRASEDRIAHDMDLVIHLGAKWVGLTKLRKEHPRRRDPYWSYLKGSLTKLSRSIIQVDRVYKKARIPPRTAYSSVWLYLWSHELLEHPERFDVTHKDKLMNWRVVLFPTIPIEPL